MFRKLLIHSFPILMATFYCFNPLGVDAQDHKNIRTLLFPTFGFEPETDWHFGVVSLFTLDFHEDTMTRKSNAKLEFNYTLNKQSIFETQWEYFFKEEKYKSIGEVHISRYPDFYYGIGSDTPDSAFQFQSNRFILNKTFQKNLGNSFFVGPSIGYSRYSNVSALDSDQIPFEELKNRSSLALGANASLDHRNNLLNTSSGHLMSLALNYNFSEEDYWNLNIDLRKYWSIDRHVIALNFISEFTFNTPTFYDYSLIGGSNQVRGYFRGRYRDLHLTALQAEYRTPQWKRLGLAFFGGTAFVYSHADQLTFDNHKSNLGTGLRFLIDRKENVNLRFDYGIGVDGNSGFYIAFGESF